MATINKTPLFDNWLRKLKDFKAKFVINNRLSQIEQQDYFGDYKALGGGLFELRIHYGQGYRIYYAQEGNTTYLLLVGGDKSTQVEDVKKARNLWKLLKH